MFSVTPFSFNLVMDIALMGAGIFVFSRGYVAARKRWMIRNIPTSPIRSVAMGLAEVAGFARQKFPLTSPQWGVDCVYFRYTIEELHRSSKGGSHWRVIEQGASAQPFYVEDQTGTLLVNPAGADPAMPYDHRSVEGRFRRTEWFIKPGDPVYVLGTVRKNRDHLEEHAMRVTEKLRLIKQDPQRMKTADSDGDGHIDIPEWNAVRDAAEAEARTDETRESCANPQDDLVIAQGDVEKIFILSDGDETDAAAHYFWRGGAQTVLGLCMIIVMGISLLAHLSVVPESLSIMRYF